MWPTTGMHNEQNNAVKLGLDGLVDLQLNAVPTVELLPALDQAARGEGMTCSCCPNKLTKVRTGPTVEEQDRLLGWHLGVSL